MGRQAPTDMLCIMILRPFNHSMGVGKRASFSNTVRTDAAKNAKFRNMVQF